PVLAGAICLASAVRVGARSWPWLALGLGLLTVARASAWRTPAVLALVACVTWALWAWNPASLTRPLPHRFARGEPPHPPERARLLDLLNVGCILVPASVQLDAERLELAPAGAVGDTVLYRRAHPLPRAFLVQRALAAPDADAAWQALLRPGFDPAREAILEW